MRFSALNKLALSTKLALILSGLSLLLVLAVMLSIKASFDRGFERYINQSIGERMELLAAQLAVDANEFDQLLHNRRHWERYLRHQLRDMEPEPPSTPGAYPQTQPPRRDMARWGVVRRSVWLLPPGGYPQAQAQATEPLPPLEQLRLLPLHTTDGLLGYLAWRPLKPRDSLLEARFAERQHRLFALIALVAVAFSWLLAWPLSRYLVNPVRRLSGAMGALTRREFQQRVPVESRDELGQLAADFNRLAEALETQDQQQRQWLADISHELRTPLGVMKGELEAMEDGVMPLDQARVRSLSEEVNQLARLMDDLHQLAVTQVSHLRYQFETLDLADVLRQMGERFAPMMQQARLGWTLALPDTPVWILADRLRLEQLLMNLAQNSVRYTDPGGEVYVCLTLGERAMLAWEDSTPGVDEADLAHLFDRFYRVERSRQRSLGGSGLGLSIVANIARAHGASLSASAAPLGGLRVVCSFESAEPPQ